ncbi:MAG: helix-turn-helix domain-containing protein [Deltaproteobacteria bacterium]|nr:helix-turn-helix domain-containing protein [Deltaproteobacteria bacterium]
MFQLIHNTTMRAKAKDMLSVREAAGILGISRTHVLRKINAGEIFAQKVGRSFIINTSDLPGIHKPLTSRDKQEVEAAVDRTFKEFETVIRKLGKT